MQEGRDLLNAGKIPEACAKLSESYGLDPALGTLLEVATCHEKEGKLASAWSELTEAATIARGSHQEEQAATATKRAEALQGQVSFVVLALPAPLPPGFELRIDGKVIASAAGQKHAIDAGTHRIEARAPEKQPWTRELVVASGSNELSLEVPTLADAPSTPPPPITNDVPPPAASSSSSLSTIGYVTAGVGAAAIIVGSIFGVRTLGLKSDRDEHCTANNVCDREGVALDDDARSAATVSTIAFASGLVLAAAGVALVLVSPSKSSQARVDLRVGSIGGRW